MVASGVASKGLDFSEIQHVINFTMPKEIEVSSRASIPSQYRLLMKTSFRITSIKSVVPDVPAKLVSRRRLSTCKLRSKPCSI